MSFNADSKLCRSLKIPWRPSRLPNNQCGLRCIEQTTTKTFRAESDWECISLKSGKSIAGSGDILKGNVCFTLEFSIKFNFKIQIRCQFGWNNSVLSVGCCLWDGCDCCCCLRYSFDVMRMRQCCDAMIRLEWQLHCLQKILNKWINGSQRLELGGGYSHSMR